MPCQGSPQLVDFRNWVMQVHGVLQLWLPWLMLAFLPGLLGTQLQQAVHLPHTCQSAAGVLTAIHVLPQMWTQRQALCVHSKHDLIHQVVYMVAAVLPASRRKASRGVVQHSQTHSRPLAATGAQAVAAAQQAVTP
jgi:hypothetical protein